MRFFSAKAKCIKLVINAPESKFFFYFNFYVDGEAEMINIICIKC